MTKRPAGTLATAVMCAMLGAAAGAAEVAEYTVDTSNYSIAKSLTGQPGDPVNGKAVAIDRRKGNCLSCHVMPIPEQPFHGAIAPPLTGVGSRYDAGQLRLRVVDPKVLNPNTIMPAFHRVAGLHRVLPDFEGKPILSAQEVEDVVAYLATIK